jgi:hypothetical protein
MYTFNYSVLPPFVYANIYTLYMSANTELPDIRGAWLSQIPRISYKQLDFDHNVTGAIKLL